MGNAYLTKDGRVITANLETNPAAITGHNQIYSNAAGEFRIIDGSGNVVIIGGVSMPTFKSYELSTGPTGDHYLGGFFNFAAAAADLNQGALTQTHGSANIPYGAHAFVVTNAAGTTDAGTVALVVVGTSMTDAGARVASDSEVLFADITVTVANQQKETGKKWIGQITFALTETGGSPTTYASTFNYGTAKYEDFGNRNFKVTDFEIIGEGNATDTGFNAELLHYRANTTGNSWTFSGAAFDPNVNKIVSLADDYVTEKNLVSGQFFAYKRSSLATSIDGDNSEGVIIHITTGTNNSILFADAHVGVTF